MAKDYIKGKVIKKEFSNGGHILKISIPMDEINRIQKKDWINIEVAEMKEPRQDPKGNIQTHYMTNNDWQAEGSADHPEAGKEKLADDISVSSIPF